LGFFFLLLLSQLTACLRRLTLLGGPMSLLGPRPPRSSLYRHLLAEGGVRTHTQNRGGGPHAHTFSFFYF
jgi:lipopolysaccharide/colanic/teichoic acid biosynthesis glycosyltransferase